MRDKSILVDKQKRIWCLMERNDNSIVLYYTLPDSPGHWVVWDSLDDGDNLIMFVDTKTLMGVNDDLTKSSGRNRTDN